MNTAVNICYLIVTFFSEHCVRDVKSFVNCVNVLNFRKVLAYSVKKSVM